jgi:dTDP-4-dehydrorhamnose 3,5-epimerase
MLWIPPGFAHGFETLEDETIFSYKVTNDYNKESEGSILWNDKILNIEWETKDPIVSEKDTNSELFQNFNSLF